MAKGLCRCNRMSFLGVKWLEDGVERRMPWVEIDVALR